MLFALTLVKDTNMLEQGQASSLHLRKMNDEAVHSEVYNDKKTAPDATHTETSLKDTEKKNSFSHYYGVKPQVSLLLTF